MNGNLRSFLHFLRVFPLVMALFYIVPSADATLDMDRLSKQDINQVQNLLVKLAPIIQKRRERQNLANLTFEELCAGLSKTQKDFLRNFQNLDAEKVGVKLPYRGIATGKEKFLVIKGQKVTSKGKPYTLPPQFLTENVYKSYAAMMTAMHKDIGRRLYIESGYRSSAYQLYLFISYLKNHSYSVKETAKYCALPGYSEHGDPKHQAIDFINENGINQDRPKEFENLVEYHWLLKNAAKYNFVLSYPRNSKEGIAFEPWHWRYENRKLANEN